MKKQTKFGLVLAAAAVISVSVASLVSARGWVQNGADWYYVDSNNEYVTDTIQSSGNAKFYLGEDGAMQRDYFLEDYNDNTYYFGSNGAMVTNTWVAVESSRVENQDDYVPDNYWYYFQASGKAMKASSNGIKKTTIDGKKYAFNEYGQMCIGWIDENGKTIDPDAGDENPFSTAIYYAGGDNDGVLRSGWVTYYDGYDGGDDDNPAGGYTNIYFYFNTSNNKKYGADGAVYKKINGRNYAFSAEGVMYSGWDVFNNRETDGWETLADKTTYFSGEDDGHQVKKGWIYAVPAESIDAGKNADDDEAYMYFNANGDSVRDQFKKINGKFYAFNSAGIMQTGLVVWCPAGLAASTVDHYRFVGTLDMDWAEGSDVTKKGILQIGGTRYLRVDPEGHIINYRDTNQEDPIPTTLFANKTTLPAEYNLPDYVKLHYFGDDGARKTGANSVEFSDDVYTINTTGANGDKGSGQFAKKYYSLGIQLKASTDIRYGIYNNATFNDGTYRGPFEAQSADGISMQGYYANLAAGNYKVLTTGGGTQKGSDGAKKDADGNFWYIERSSSNLKGIWVVNINGNRSVGSFTTKTVSNPGGWVSGATASTAEVVNGKGAAGAISNLFVLGCGGTTNGGDNSFDNVIWTAHTTNHERSVYFTYDTTWKYGQADNQTVTQITYKGPAFQTDYRDGSNKWIPVGVLDNSNKTVTLNYNVGDARAHAYEVKPSDEYFLNCYWKDNSKDDVIPGVSR